MIRANDFPISYRQQAKNKISADILADSADIYNKGCVVSETYPTRVSEMRVVCIFKNLSRVHVSCLFQCCHVTVRATLGISKIDIVREVTKL